MRSAAGGSGRAEEVGDHVAVRLSGGTPVWAATVQVDGPRCRAHPGDRQGWGGPKGDVSKDSDRARRPWKQTGYGREAEPR